MLALYSEHKDHGSLEVFEEDYENVKRLYEALSSLDVSNNLYYYV